MPTLCNNNNFSSPISLFLCSYSPCSRCPSNNQWHNPTIRTISNSFNSQISKSCHLNPFTNSPLLNTRTHLPNTNSHLSNSNSLFLPNIHINSNSLYKEVSIRINNFNRCSLKIKITINKFPNKPFKIAISQGTTMNKTLTRI